MNDLDKKLLQASRKNDSEQVKKLIKAGADVNARDENGYTPLLFAAFWGYTEIVEKLIKAGADVNGKSDFGDTP